MKPSINWLFALSPATVAIEHAGAPAPSVFFGAAVAIVPIARLIVRSTEQRSTYTGDAVGALVAGDGRSNWFKGVQLVAVYLIIALMFYFIPVVS
jgi:Ca2+/H+ antiporter